MTHLRPIETPSEAELATEIEWERGCHEEGVARYRRSQLRTVHHKDGHTSTIDADICDTRPGQIIIERAMKECHDGIVALAEEGRTHITSGTKEGGSAAADWWYVLGMLDPLDLAFIAIRSVLTIRMSGKDKVASNNKRTIESLSMKIGNAVRLQLEYEMWKKADETKAKKERVHPHSIIIYSTSLYQQLLNYSGGQVNKQVWIRWKRKIRTIESEVWSHNMVVSVGSVLLYALLKFCPTFITKEQVRTGVKTEYRIHLTDGVYQALNDLNAKLEVNRPFCLPMICRPIPWTRA